MAQGGRGRRGPPPRRQAALKTGYAYAVRHGYDACVQIDADGQHDVGTARTLLTAVLSGEADIVIGSRFLGGATVEMVPARRAGSAVLRFVARALGVRSTDPTSEKSSCSLSSPRAS